MKKSGFLLVMLMLMFTLSGCGGDKSTNKGATSKVPGDVLIIGMASDLGTLDPGVSMDNASWKITYPCYDRLVKYKVVNGKSTTEVEPMLAESWTTSDDGRVWTFKLRKGVKFHDGSDLDANAVKFSFDRVVKIKKGPSDYFPTLSEVVVVDKDTVKFILKEPFPPFVYTLATNGASIINPKVMAHEKDGDMGAGYLADHTMGSGPYEMTEWNRSQNIKLVAKDSYWGTKPVLKTVLVQFIKDSSAQKLQLENGDIDIAENIAIDQIDQMKSNAAIKIHEEPSLLVSYIYINNKKPLLDNVKVRQAISYALDYKAIIDGTIKGKGIQLVGPIPKGLWGYDESLKGYSLDRDKAKALLNEAGVKEGAALKLLYSDYKSFWESEALLIQDSLSKVGIKVNLEKVAWATLRDKVDRGDFDLCLGSWSPDYADPQMFMTYWYDSRMFGLSGNRAFYKNDKVDELLRNAEKITDQKERTKLYQEAQKIVVDEAAYGLLFQSNSIIAMRKSVEGYAYNPMLEFIYNLETMKKSN